MTGEDGSGRRFVGLSEVADLLGVGKPNAHKLMARPDAPGAAEQLATGRFWWLDEVETFRDRIVAERASRAEAAS